MVQPAPTNMQLQETSAFNSLSPLFLKPTPYESGLGQTVQPHSLFCGEWTSVDTVLTRMYERRQSEQLRGCLMTVTGSFVALPQQET